MRFGRKDPADTLGGTVERQEGGKRFTAADLAARCPGSVVREYRPEADTSRVLPGRDAAGEGVGGEVIFGVEGFEAPRAQDADVGFSHRDTLPQLGEEP